MEFSPEILAILNKNTPYLTNFVLKIEHHQVKNIFERVKTNILNWAITLEKQGILGDDIGFSQKEKDIINNNPIIYNYTNNFYGSVDNTNLQQGNEDSKQTKK